MNPLKEKETMEPILQENKSRHVLYPIEHPDLFAFDKKAVASFWVADEIDFGQDLAQLEKLSDDEKHFIFHVLAFFAASDGVVMENLSMRFSNEVPNAETRAFYAIQNAIATIGENMTARRVAELSVNKGVVGAYLHSAIGDGLGRHVQRLLPGVGIKSFDRQADRTGA